MHIDVPRVRGLVVVQGIGWNMSQFPRSSACIIVYSDYNAHCMKPWHHCHRFKREGPKELTPGYKANREPDLSCVGSIQPRIPASPPGNHTEGPAKQKGYPSSSDLRAAKS
jgi:hypothetical protein